MNKRTCSYPGCERVHDSNGYCGSHVAQLRRGRELSPLRKMLPKGTSIAIRLETYTEKTDTCWLWTGALSAKGYGNIGGGASTQAAHRVAFEIAFGPIAKGRDIDHRCFVRRCVNPDHLRTTTRKQNMEHLKGAYASSKTGVRGVYYWEARRKYVAAVTHNGTVHRLGYFDSLPEANAAVRAKRAELFTHDDAVY